MQQSTHKTRDTCVKDCPLSSRVTRYLYATNEIRTHARPARETRRLHRIVSLEMQRKTFSCRTLGYIARERVAEHWRGGVTSTLRTELTHIHHLARESDDDNDVSRALAELFSFARQSHNGILDVWTFGDKGSSIGELWKIRQRGVHCAFL